jgi:hypothetical protein
MAMRGDSVAQLLLTQSFEPWTLFVLRPRSRVFGQTELCGRLGDEIDQAAW